MSGSEKKLYPLWFGWVNTLKDTVPIYGAYANNAEVSETFLCEILALRPSQVGRVPHYRVQRMSREDMMVLTLNIMGLKHVSDVERCCLVESWERLRVVNGATSESLMGNTFGVGNRGKQATGARNTGRAAAGVSRPHEYPWTAEEDEALVAHIQSVGAKDWKLCAEKVAAVTPAENRDHLHSHRWGTSAAFT